MYLEELRLFVHRRGAVPIVLYVIYICVKYTL